MRQWEVDSKHYRFEFGSWGEFIDYLREPHTANTRHTDSHESGGGWNGTRNFQDALKLADEGWQEGYNKIKRLTAGFVDKLASQIEVQEPVYDVEGSGFDTALVLEGVPEHWVRFETEIQQGAGKILRIRFAASASCAVSDSVMFARGAVMAALIELLELAGHRCEVYVNPVDAGDSKSGGDLHINASVLFKAADQPLDMARLAFAYCNAATLRRFGFYLMELAPARFAELCSQSYGYAVDSPQSVADSDLYIGVASKKGGPQWNDPAVARAWIIEKLKQFGVALTDSD